MSLFRSAVDEDKRLKLFLFGPSGVGKTITTLYFPNIALIDLDGGTDHYAKHFEFKRLKTSDIDTIYQAVDELINDPGEIRTFVLDSMTRFYDLLQDKHLRRLRVKKGNPNYTLQPADYKVIKSDLKMLINKLIALDMNVVITAQSKPEYDSSGGEFMKIVGQTSDSPKEVPYLMDTVLELQVAPDGESRIAKTIKDRTNTLPRTFEFTYDQMVSYFDMDKLKRKAKKEVAQEKLSTGARRTTEIVVNGEKLMSAGITTETYGRILKVVKEKDPNIIRDKLTEDYSVSNILDLREDEAKLFLEDITNS